jgi:hypothetical protein
MVLFDSNIAICKCVGLLTRLILGVWQMLPSNSYMFLDKSTILVAFGMP